MLSSRGGLSAAPSATDSIEAAADADVVFLGLKPTAFPSSRPDRRGPQPAYAVIAAQNGIPWWYFQHLQGPLGGHVLASVDPDGVINAAIKAENVIGCVVYCATEIVAPGVIKHIEGNRFTIGEPDGSADDRCQTISRAFIAAGLKCPVAVQQGLREEIWLKLVGNTASKTQSQRSPARPSQNSARSGNGHPTSNDHGRMRCGRQRNRDNNPHRARTPSSSSP